MTTVREERFFVPSDGEKPVFVRFDRAAAEATAMPYIGSFDEEGNPLKTYKLGDGGYFCLEDHT